MVDKAQPKFEKYSFDEDPDIMARIDKIARDEGTQRATIIRRALRQWLFSLPTTPTSGCVPENNQTA